MIDPDDYLEESEEDIFDLADEAYDRKRLEDHEKQEQFNKHLYDNKTQTIQD